MDEKNGESALGPDVEGILLKRRRNGWPGALMLAVPPPISMPFASDVLTKLKNYQKLRKNHCATIIQKLLCGYALRNRLESDLNRAKI